MTIRTFRSKTDFAEWALDKFWGTDDQAVREGEDRYSIYYRLGYSDWADGILNWPDEPTRRAGYQRGVEDAKGDWEAFSESS